MLIGFCGESGDDHECSFGVEIVVGTGDTGYENIVSTFKNYIQGMYARVIIVNPLHQSLPRLALCALATCNRFTADWVRRQWEELKRMWDLYCREGVGPVIGHASDGDARRRKLMLEDYLGKSNDLPRYSVGWEGWRMSVSVLPNGDREGFGDQDQPHNGKKLINPLDRVTNLIVLGDAFVALGHVDKVYNVFSQDEHGLCYDDIQRTDRQNWAGPQRLASRKVQCLLFALSSERTAQDMHEKTLGTMFYLEVCGDYIDIFFSKKLDVRGRIVLASKVSFFFRLWRLWLKFGDHSVTGNRSVSEKNMVSIQAFHDVNMSCHFIVLLICYFRDKFSTLQVPFHLLGSDCVEIFFSKVGGMSGHERNYDFGSLLDSAVGINRLSCFEYGEEELRVGRSHKKQDHIWGKLHPLCAGETAPDLFDYTLVATDALVVEALKEGLGLARDICVKLNMSPHSSKPAAEKRWWLTPWAVEAETWVNEVASLPDAAPEDNEVEPLPSEPSREPSEDDPEAELDQLDEWETVQDTNLAEAASSLISPDDISLDAYVELEVLGHEVRHVLSASLIPAFVESNRREKIDPTVTFQGRVIFKSTLVSQLVQNVHLSKDRLTRVKQSLYISGSKRKALDVGNVCLVDLGIDCAVLFEGVGGAETTRSTRAAKAIQTSKGKGKKGAGRATRAAATQQPTSEIWIGRVQMIKRKHNAAWKKSRWPVDLMDRGPEGQVMLLFYWYKPIGNSKSKYSYDTNDLVWIELEMVISSITMTFQNGTRPHWVLDAQDRVVLDNYLKNLDK